MDEELVSWLGILLIIIVVWTVYRKDLAAIMFGPTTVNIPSGFGVPSGPYTSSDQMSVFTGANGQVVG